MNNFGNRFLMSLTVLFSLFTGAIAQSKGFDISRMDTSVDACEDFSQYANGNWLKNTEIPPSFSRWGSFNILIDNNQAILKDILEKAAADKSAAAGSDSQLIGDFYASCMDEAAIEKAGTQPLDKYFKQIGDVKDTKGLQRLIASFHAEGIPSTFAFGVGPDLKSSRMNIANAGQAGLSLPNRDYYTKTDPKSQEARQKFVEYSTNVFKLLGDSPDAAAANAKTVLDFQTRLANASKSPVELRDPQSQYNKKTLAQLAELTPNFSWTDYMKIRGIPPVQEINVSQPDFFVEVNKMLADVPLDQWKTYIRWMLISSSTATLPKAFVDESFNFYGKYLQGAKEQQPRWKRCVAAADNSVGEALGQEFVKRTYTPEAKKRMTEIIDNLLAVFKERINGLDWMSPETKQKAQIKLAAFKRKIGYPDELLGYKGLNIDRNSYLENSKRIAKFSIARNLEKANKPVDVKLWGMTPPTVNAGYSPIFNDITFPAGVLQPPFFNFQADDAINYGAIGGGIGHEVTHGFDDQGSQFDAEGNLKSWWTPEDRAKFDERAACVVDQYNGYEIEKGLNINGKLTLGENIADLGGLTMAYLAFQKSLEGKPRPANIDGFTPEQRFFLGWAQVWSSKSTPEFQRQQALSDVHSNERYRINGPLSNLPQFAKAFGCKDTSAMVRKNACLIW